MTKQAVKTTIPKPAPEAASEQPKGAPEGQPAGDNEVVSFRKQAFETAMNLLLEATNKPTTNAVVLQILQGAKVAG